VILLDANILIYAYASDSPFHVETRFWLEEIMNRGEPIGLSWDTILAFLRIVTNPSATSAGLSGLEAVEVIDSIISRNHVNVVVPTPKHWERLRVMLHGLQITRNLVMDAHLAALALEHQASLCTNDRDFLRFRGLHLVNPVKQG
jgi:toxin-antitoxin system PIN domain toxin